MESRHLPPEAIKELRADVEESANESFPVVDLGDGDIPGPFFLRMLEEMIENGEVRPDSMDAFEELKIHVTRIQASRMGSFPGYAEGQIVFIPLSDLEADYPKNWQSLQSPRGLSRVHD